MSDVISDTAAAVDETELYGRDYYHSHCGDIPYTPDSPEWLDFYGHIADEIVRSLTPRRVFDAGCAVGFLVTALRDRNVEAFGRDISSFAISQVRADVRDYCTVGSIAAPIEGDFDLILCIEVLEHMPEDEALEAITAMTRAAPRILFSSSPSDFVEPTHVNVHPVLYWLQRFAAAGFEPVTQYDASYLVPHALLLERAQEGRTSPDLHAMAEIVRERIGRDAEKRKGAEAEARIAKLMEALAAEQWAKADAEGRAAEFERLATTPMRVERLGKKFARVGLWTVRGELPARIRQRRGLPPPGAAVAAPAQPSGAPQAAAQAVAGRFAYNEPLRTFAIPGSARRLSVVTDSIAEGFLFGGVGTAVILATLLASRLDARLRLITRTHPADVHRLKVVLAAQGLEWPTEIEVLHAPPGSGQSIPMGSGDFLLTTSWWTTRAALLSVPAERVIYLLQEDERMFYPYCDDRLRCSETLARTDLRIVVNSRLLYEHLASGPEPLPELASRARWFEPAFPSGLFHDDPARGRDGPRRRFLFYARPNNLRNLYWRGLEAIIAALEESVLDADSWSFTFVGKDIQPVSLPGGIVPRILQNLPWDEYAAIVRQTHLGLALMDTPHPSYPPLDMAASGTVVVTNRHGLKQSLDAYSRNIIAAPPTVDGLCRGLADAVALVGDETTRLRNYAEAPLQRDWRGALESTVEACRGWVEG